MTLIEHNLREALPELEQAVNSAEWQQVVTSFDDEFSRDGLRTIVRLAQIMYLKNPLIKRGIEVKANYVFGRGMTVTAADELINDVIQAFWNDNENAAELTGHIEQVNAEVTLETDGNLFLVLFPHIETGHIRIGSIPFDEITEVIRDPDNARHIWLYKREYDKETFDFATGRTKRERTIEYFKDWLFNTEQTEIGGKPIRQDCVMYHVKIGGFRHWVFGVPEVYAALDWARAYKDFLQDFASLMRALAQYAWLIKTTGGTRGVQAAKSVIGTTLSASNGVDTNPPANAGSTVIGNEAFNISALKTAGATTSAEEGRPILLMVAAAVGLPESFFGNVQGTYATAHALDRPTELAFTNRQQLWSSVYERILSFVLRYAVIAPNGALRGIADVTTNEYGEEIVVFDEGIDTHIDIDFPSVLERDTQQYIASIISAATLDNKIPSVITDKKLLARMLLTALGEDDIDQIVDALYLEGEQTEDEIAAPVQEAITALRETIEKIGIKLTEMQT